ncbi:putative sterol esterase [Clavispora lusitaniae]|uniref:Partial AB-hydrolase lipase domain-containing protein n=2 Tax=Clavispora lusitaniae TaxID=36911 RepID=C4Y4F2_CLAL4|nr:uncharacterized protein CLUG_02524 [Clavispora lusitaniae ATCC 42720]KAF5211370.1 hypothetical protein E0198_002677 [Clavispora lusitaniae]EEQ38398.1 hypothetical protein CLUG_02524 [Clavispora lusitaniae ATCC 42720]KAF7580205.1 putative alpha/beta-hydrolase lipase region family protein [Clavispora lusitaniae]QFZ27768.1 putative sterol esterase [Clavispora lusitaniae]QFZ32925.1 putative sterol esterase [Clavispora lusitaniae]
MSKFDPPEKKARHAAVSRHFHIFCSAIGSFLFLVSLLFGAIIYHIRDLVSGREKQNAPKKDNSVSNYTVREPFPDMKNLKVTKDLRYYALQLGLDLEEYQIITKDGYGLSLHRLIDPKDTEEKRNNRKPCLLQHGLLSCSGAWLTPGQNSLPFYFLEQGYDVWMGNNRCGFEPKHEHYSGNLMHNEEFWDWDIRSLASFDLPCIMDNVLSHKPNHDKLVLVGHSQGCTQSFLMLRNSKFTEYHKKIEKFFALAPAIFPGSMFHDRTFIKFIHNRSPRAYDAIFGICCFMKILGTTRKLIGTTRLFATLSYQMFKYLFGWGINNCHPDKKLLRIQFLFNVSYVSSRLMSWWLSYSVEEGFSNQLQPKEAFQTGLNYAFTPVNSNENVLVVDADEADIPHSEASATEQEKSSEPQGNSADLEKSSPDKKVIPKPLTKTVPLTDDSKTFFPYKETWFDFNDPEELVPMVLFIAGSDFLVDGERLATHMCHYERHFYKEGENLKVVRIPEFNHLDVIWSSNVIGQIGMVIEEELKSSV